MCMPKMRFEFKLLSILLKDSLYYPGRLLTASSTILIRYGVLCILYAYVFRINNGSLHSMTFASAAWSMFFYFSFYVMGLHLIADEIMRDVQSGTVETLLNKPISYFAYRIWWQIGSGLYAFLFSLTGGAIILFFVAGLPTTMITPLFFITFVLTTLACMLITLLLYGIVGLLAFWVQDVMPFGWIINKAIMVFGGSYVPVAFFIPIMYKIARYSPFGASQFITHTTYSSWRTDWYACISIQLFWITILGTIAYWLIKQATQKVSINGG